MGWFDCNCDCHGEETYGKIDWTQEERLVYKKPVEGRPGEFAALFEIFHTGVEEKTGKVYKSSKDFVIRMLKE